MVAACTSQPPGVDQPEVYRAARSGYFLSQDQNAWQEVYTKTLANAVHP